MPASPTRLVEARFDSTSVGATVDYRVLLPADWAQGERVPLLLHLHGALSSSASLEQARPLYDDQLAQGRFPRAVVACASTPTRGGFYIDGPGAAWETAVAVEFPEHLRSLYGPFTATGLTGASMGGYGALKIAFAAPERFAAVAALSPAVFPGETPNDVPRRNLQAVLGDLHQAMSGGTGDASTYSSNSVYARARLYAGRIRAAALPILIDCGAADEFLLHEGAEHLHQVLTELGVGHQYRLVPGAGHLGPATEARTAAAIQFVGTALTDPRDGDR